MAKIAVFLVLFLIVSCSVYEIQTAEQQNLSYTGHVKRGRSFLTPKVCRNGYIFVKGKCFKIFQPKLRDSNETGVTDVGAR
ncbi:unnamed protein product [Phyllotreta striolata]|uniref:Uncharacterized protein n=1 Tax=Phyllotreta striolata TaxID=444603 RepID=A0A9N9TIX9_PHYSR|nr:unnamed protein product [Phyllotreta striolata]